jgi:hypothetical protein
MIEYPLIEVGPLLALTITSTIPFLFSSLLSSPHPHPINNLRPSLSFSEDKLRLITLQGSIDFCHRITHCFLTPVVSCLIKYPTNSSSDSPSQPATLPLSPSWQPPDLPAPSTPPPHSPSLLSSPHYLQVHTPPFPPPLCW